MDDLSLNGIEQEKKKKKKNVYIVIATNIFIFIFVLVANRVVSVMYICMPNPIVLIFE